MIKTYYARSYTIYSLKGVVKSEGGESKVVSVSFNQSTSSYGTAFYTTNREEEQLLIEQSADFHRGAIFIARQQEEEKKAKQEEVTVSKNKQEIETKDAKVYKDRADLYNKLTVLLPNEQINKRTTELQLLEVAKKNNLLFVRS